MTRFYISITGPPGYYLLLNATLVMLLFDADWFKFSIYHSRLFDLSLK
jgi:hypothetical protein